ncbi:SusC/RagA family TonB-linked outer membrane protein [Rhodocytophaga aerolata]|uniref:SusC/RagA family TonB-linked outer membrane protein n=1 Tax=Rhodocytophaga aerolata TaxID=455078 RepID=A0ABT8R8Y5_9BACT|nr:SusC/RagA family TonB-linked outer membrane protein [Rhodocytophaga aerolata]MDO1448547.1 SusC/RagA family TonB-linked outer membrane protein [Rhodocytophaga aerolata]
MKKILLMCAALLLIITSHSQLWAQERTVTGKVTSADDGTALPGVNVIVKGTNNGTTTSADGTYSISAAGDATLVFSFIGLTTQEVAIANRSTVNVQMGSDVTELTEIVVTAQGIERDQRSLGYAVQSVNGDKLAQRSEPNLLNSLQGKVAGVNILGASGAPGASTNINIRGITSFNGSNQPLIVVDGIIFSNDLNNTQNTLFGSQPSNRLADINPENIESINILKGPAAAVLYGSRASAGAIVITTKSGKNLNNKTEVTVNSSVNFQNVYGLPRYQNQYGQGANNDYVNNSTNSWGPAFGTPGYATVINLQGEEVPYQAYPNNVRDFFDTGRILQNSVNIASGDADKNFALSLGSTLQNGVIPGTKFNRHNVQIGGNTKLNNGLKVGTQISYVNTGQSGTPMGNGGSAFGQLTRIPRSYDLTGRPYTNEQGRSIYFLTTQNHPLWSTENEVLDGQVDRVFGNFSLGYDITDWFSVTYRATADVYSDRRKLTLQIGSARAPLGQLVEDNFFRQELNQDIILTFKKDNLFFENFNANALLGHNLNQRRFQNSSVVGESLTIPQFTNVSNASVFTSSAEESSLRRLVGYYGQVSFDYNNFAFLELSGRVDQSSTLPKANNAYFYPAAAISFVPTDAFNVESNILSYAKVRASIARVGRDADPYLLNTVYVPATYGNNLASITFPMSVGSASIPGFQIGSRIGSNELTPEFVTSYEFGANLGLFQNRFGLDVTYFESKSTNQIFDVAVPNTTGYDTRTTNVGELENKGWEAVLTTSPIKTSAFSWDINLNFTRIRNKVVSIAPGVTQSNIDGDLFIGIAPSIVEGQPYGVIVGTANARNDAGEYLINPTNGLFVPGIAGEVIANPNPDWTAGLTNTFNYKGFSLSVLVDTRQGGDLYSFGAVDLRGNGSLAVTAIDRDQPRILPGVIDNGDGTYRPNNIQISAQSYWAGLGGLASEAAVFDATVYRLRELALNYSLPSGLLSKTPFGSVTFGVSGRNLYFFAPNFIGDPEVNTQGAGNIQGMDLNGAPNTRNYGFNIRFTL